MPANETGKKGRQPWKIVLFTAAATLLIAGTVAYVTGLLGPARRAEIPEAHEDMKQPAGETPQEEIKKDRKILYWRAPMNPSEIYDKPGKSAMGMDLVPVYAEEVAGGPGITIDPVIQQNMGIRTAPVRKGPLVHTIRTYGHITADETRTVRVSPKTSGWIEKLYVDFTGKFVEKGDPLFELYAPKLVAAQEEYLVARRTLSTGAPQGRGDLLKSALRRLTYFDVAESEIREIEEAGIMKKALMIRSPSTGHVIRKTVEEGDFIREGAMIFRISDLSRVWVEAHIFEYELPWIRKGQEAEMTLSYIPGKIFVGKVTFVYPYLQPETRDVVVRLEFENPDLELKPDMYADVLIKPMADEQGLIIPSEAVIRSGIRNMVFVVLENGKFSPRDVVLGRHLDDGNVEILAGVFEGETVVTSGQFLLDSESKLKEAVQKMLDTQMEKKMEKEAFEGIE